MDRNLVDLARHGDREAFAILVHQVSDQLYAIAFRILRDPGMAEDALQNALVLTWRQLPRLRDLDRFEAWCHRILVHACYDESARTRQWRSTVRVLPVDGPAARDDTRLVADRDELERAFRQIPVDQAAVFVLHHYLGLPLVEIAAAPGDPRGHRPIPSALRDPGPAIGRRGRRRAADPGRTTRMTDDAALRAPRARLAGTGPRRGARPTSSRPPSSRSTRRARSGTHASRGGARRWAAPPSPRPRPSCCWWRAGA